MLGRAKLLIKSKLNRSIIVSDSVVVNADCEKFEVNNWMLSEFVIKKLVPVVGVHPYPVNELCLMAAAVCYLKPTHIFEWGTNLGKSARVFSETSRCFETKSKIYSVDLPDDVEHVEHPHEKRGMYVKGLQDVDLLLGDGLGTSLQIYLEQKEQCSAVSPLFFIDGDHSYDSVRQELSTIVEKIPDASILLHDTFYQSKESNYNTGPFRAVEDVLADAPHRYHVLSQNLGLPGMTLLYKK